MGEQNSECEGIITKTGRKNQDNIPFFASLEGGLEWPLSTRNKGSVASALSPGEQ